MGMVRRGLVLLLAFVAVGAGAPAAYACSCAGPRDYAQAVAEADVAFTGEVVDVSGNRYATRVDGVIKGRLPPRVTLHAESRDSASCGRTLERGPIVYAGTSDLLVAACMSIWTGSSALPVAARAETYAPDPSAPDPGRSRTGPVLLAVAALAVAGGALLRSRRSRYGALVVLLAYGAVGLSASSAYACSCAQPPEVDVAMQRATFAFYGEVVRPLGDDRYEFRVHEVYRGSLPPVVTLEAEGTHSSCGLTLDNGPRVYVGSDRLYVQQCMSGLRGDAAVAYAANHPGRPPDAAAPDPGGPQPEGRAGPVVLALVLLGAVGVVAVVRTRRNAVASAAGTTSAG